jgi:hypothetical protein
MQIDRFVRKSFPVEAVQVTKENLLEVTAWCGGKLLVTGLDHAKGAGRPYVKVNVGKTLHEDQDKAFPGNWVLKLGGTFKVYTSGAFKASFDPMLETEPAVS